MSRRKKRTGEIYTGEVSLVERKGLGDYTGEVSMVERKGLGDLYRREVSLVQSKGLSRSLQEIGQAGRE